MLALAFGMQIGCTPTIVVKPQESQMLEAARHLGVQVKSQDTHVVAHAVGIDAKVADQGSALTRPDQIAWYAEGLNTTLLPRRAGLMPFETYQSAINHAAKEYYTSPARTWSQAQIGKVGFGDELVRHTLYNRGALYWAHLDWRIQSEIRLQTQTRRLLPSAVDGASEGYAL